MTSDNDQAMKNLFAVYDDDDDANESRYKIKINTYV